MAHIAVSRDNDETFTVEIREGTRTTNHRVTIPPELPRRLSCAEVDPEDLVRASFEFLLQREPPGAILPRFRLDQIADYFPEYEREIGRYVRGSR
jgi:hypothetical protein